MMQAILLIALSLYSLSCAALPAAKLEILQSGLAQPVAVAWNDNGQLALLDLAGLQLGPQNPKRIGQEQVPASTLDVYASGQDWWLADPVGGKLLRFNVQGQLQQTLSAKNLLPSTPVLGEQTTARPSNSEPVSASSDGSHALRGNLVGDAPASRTAERFQLHSHAERGNDESPASAEQTVKEPATPEPVAVAVYQQVLFWADRANHRICRYDLVKQQALNCFGKRGEMDGEFQYPYQMLFDADGYLYVSDILNARIQVFDASGRFFSQIGQFGSDSRQLFRPNGIAMDRDNKLLFVSDSYFGSIKVFKAGEALGELTDEQGQVIRLQSPTGLAWRNGKLYAAETLAGRVVALSVSELGKVEVAKKPDTTTSGDEVSQKNCQICHLSWAKTGNQPDKQGMLPEASLLMCYSCHNGAVLDSRQRIGQGEQHASVYDEQKRKDERHKQKREDKLPEIFPRTADKELPCSSCHTPHTKGEGNDTLYEGHKNAWLRTPNKGGDMCERCHESKIKNARETDVKKRGLNHPLALKLAEPPRQDDPAYASDDNLHHGLPKKLDAAGGVLGHQQELVCQSCHQIHGGHGEDALTALAEDKGQLCGSCHERQFSASKENARHKGVHPVNVKPDKPMKRHDKKVEFVTCQTCHKVHDGKLATPLLEKETEEDLNKMCETCHDRQHAKDKDDAKKKGVHPVNLKLDDEVEIAGEKTKEVKCLTCHSVHKGKHDTPALVEDHRDGQLCSHCHAGKQAVVGSDHDLRIVAKDKVNQFKELPKSGVCGACHTLHRGENHAPHLDATKAVAEDRSDPDAEHSELKEDKLCINCHQKDGIGEKKVVKYFSHPHQDMVLRSDKKLMPLLGKGEKQEEFGEIACVTCHDPHFWTPEQFEKSKLKGAEKLPATGNKDNVEGSPINSFLRSKGVKERFCVDCHGLESISKFKYYHDKELVRNRKLDYLK